MSSIDVRVPGRAWRALAVASGGYVLFGFNSTATNLAFGSIAATFVDASETTVSWVASGYFIASAAFLPLGGRLADRWGRRLVFNLGLLGFILSAVASAAAPTIEVLIAARVAQAAAGAFVIPASLAVILPEFPVARRPSAVATWAAAGPLSAAIAPSAAASLLETTSWRVVYFVSAPVAAIALGASLLTLRESKGDDQASARLDLAGTVLAVVAVALLVVGIGQIPAWGPTDPLTLAAIVGAVLLLGLFVARSRRHPAPLVNLALFRVPEVALANVANFFMSITSLSIWLIWPLFLLRVWGYSIGQVGLAITIGPVFAGTSALVGGRLADRYGQRWLMVVGTAICTAAVTWSVFRLGPDPNYVIDFAPTVAGFGFGWGMSNPSMNSWALAHTPQAYYGEVNAAFNTIRNLAAAIGTAAGVAIVGAADRPDPLAAYERANIFFAVAVGLSFVTVALGTLWLSARRPAAEIDGALPDASSAEALRSDATPPAATPLDASRPDASPLDAFLPPDGTPPDEVPVPRRPEPATWAPPSHWAPPRRAGAPGAPRVHRPEADPQPAPTSNATSTPPLERPAPPAADAAAEIPRRTRSGRPPSIARPATPSSPPSRLEPSSADTEVRPKAPSAGGGNGATEPVPVRAGTTTTDADPKRPAALAALAGVGVVVATLIIRRVGRGSD